MQVESYKTKAAKAAEFALKLKSERDAGENMNSATGDIGSPINKNDNGHIK